MVIQTVNRDLEVTRMLKRTEELEILICRDLREDQETQYLLVCMKAPALIRRAMPFFAEQRKNPYFEDFVDCFSQGGRAYAVFRDRERPFLVEQLEQDVYSLSERLEIAKSLFTRVALCNMPSAMQYEVLKLKNVQMGDSLNVEFRYALEELAVYEEIPERQYQYALSELLEQLFQKELSGQVCPELNAFFDALDLMQCESYRSIYEQYDKVYHCLLQLLKNRKLQPKTRAFRIWERIKSWTRFIKPTLTVLLLAVLVGYLIYTILHPAQGENTETRPPIHQIGTVQLE